MLLYLCEFPGCQNNQNAAFLGTLSPRQVLSNSGLNYSLHFIIYFMMVLVASAVRLERSSVFLQR
jgi:hypothetical protein